MKVKGVFAMRRYLIAAAALTIAAVAVNVPAQAQPYYGPRQWLRPRHAL
jgi:hypothetical protein